MKAFPQQIVYVGDAKEGAYTSLAKGMDLRDYFAAKAMQQRKWDFYVGDSETEKSLKQRAKDCYQIADVMMKAREQ